MDRQHCFQELINQRPGATISIDGDTMRWGNKSGLDLAGMEKKLEETIKRVGDLEGQNHQQANEIGALGGQFQQQASEIQFLQGSSDLYHDVRNRMISVYIRTHHKEKFSDRDRRIIEEGDGAAHFGDALNDAFLYHKRLRTDENIFAELYSLPFQQVIEIREFAILSMVKLS